ncbi:MAG: hypothetical protein CBD18_04965 [Opitutales bacterium TMED158]|nr:MAG: hypothetical protein CBD18_04965 [Opitutales bacterium TMED158]
MKARRIAAVISILSIVPMVWGQDQKSPFVRPSQSAPVAAPQKVAATPLDGMEFNGVVEIGKTTWLSLYDPKTKKSYWLSKDEAAEDGITLERYDAGKQPGEESIVVRQGSMTRRLNLKNADIITLKEAPRPAPQRAAQATAPARSAPPRAQPRQQPQNIQAASDEEVRERMQRVAEEIRRRRALRKDIIDDDSN